MKVRMKVYVSGSRNGEPWPGVGEIADMPDGEGAELCAAGLAAPVADKGDKVEKAIDETPVDTRDDKPRRGRPPGSRNKPKPDEE